MYSTSVDSRRYFQSIGSRTAGGRQQQSHTDDPGPSEAGHVG